MRLAVDLISVAMPVKDGGASLAPAARCILAQTHDHLELLLVLNGSDDATRATAHDLAQADARVRVVERPRPSLAAALNHALTIARGSLVARMDADDLCPPARLARQALAMREHPELAAVGCAWELEETAGPRAGRVGATIRPPTDPREARWRLLLGNPFAHGSMMLRRRRVQAIGGYDERLDRAQDYDLWIRLSRELGVAALPEVLYRHRRRAEATHSASPLQARLAAELMLRAWRALPPSESDFGVLDSLARAMGEPGGREAALTELSQELRERGPTREALLAHLWTQSSLPAGTAAAIEACRAARVREVARDVRAAGGASVWLWGAGAHAGVVLPLVEQSGLRVAGLVDDHAPGRSHLGHVVRAPDHLRSGDDALLASDAHEAALWAASAPARARGVRVWRLYETPT